jgi:hypothetical protein
MIKSVSDWFNLIPHINSLEERVKVLEERFLPKEIEDIPKVEITQEERFPKNEGGLPFKKWGELTEEEKESRKEKMRAGLRLWHQKRREKRLKMELKKAAADGRLHRVQAPPEPTQSS